jgi:uncharacterized Zn finger protein (UPF0148 family)
MNSRPKLRLIETGARVKEFPADRKCDACESPLSRYNPDTFCGPCQTKARRLGISCDEMPLNDGGS